MNLQEFLKPRHKEKTPFHIEHALKGNSLSVEKVVEILQRYRGAMKAVASMPRDTNLSIFRDDLLEYIGFAEDELNR